MNQLTKSFAFCVLITLATTSGCSSDAPALADAGGVVTYEGKPVPGATVSFMPEQGPPAIGTTKTDGSFKLTTRGEPGAPIGPGKVAITAVEQLVEFEKEEDVSSADLQKMSKWLIPRKYGHVMSSGLTAEVRLDEDNNFTFELTN